MDAWGVWLVAIGVIVAGASAAFAWVQAHSAVESLKDARKARDAAQESAKDSARLAGEANAAFIRQAEAQEEANRIKREEMTPNDWSGPAHVSGDLYRMSNTSRGVLFVESFDVKPDEAANLVSIRTNPGWPVRVWRFVRADGDAGDGPDRREADDSLPPTGRFRGHAPHSAHRSVGRRDDEAPALV